ncbi:FKBP-type peptidyl-prolyl cis-trans isomerase [Demequina muriae]|uniref:Peptidyl-prolyl cis-trans isomerase n=1 Tax=Demequina muriae TaxID=3051664 RepID=A0ABT8GD40_9MICO|nr:FKBP-type peptidyl-prolyl cis-trans isomerase [Demequina sp. EGI L300058]MDN4479340.1 FKBP-type peptidyl-prolyl cis-trans isomerase [Demequina sp. EGI L300058]
MRSIAVTGAACALALVLSACSATEDGAEASASASGDIDLVTVVQSDTLAPDIEFQPGLDYLEEQTSVLWEGDGEALQEGQPLLLDIYGESLVDGTVMMNTFDGSPESFLMAPEIVGEGIYEALQTVRVGGRVLVVSPPGQGEDEHEPVALVVDVLPTHAQGEDQQPVAGMPEVTLGVEGEPIVEIDPDREASPDLEVATLINGGGTQVRSTSHVLVNYTMVHHDDSTADADEEWKAGDVFDSSWDSEREPLLVEMDEVSAVPGFQQGLLDQRAGSRVLMVVPPTLGYPERGSMIIVVDILDVWNPEE